MVEPSYEDPMGFGLSEGREIFNVASPRRIYEIAKRNPVVYHIVKLWETGRCTWEQAMMFAVIELEERNLSLTKEAIRRLETTTEPYFSPKKHPCGCESSKDQCPLHTR